MQVAVVTVGNELLSGDTTNTNAAWLGRELAERGVSVERVTVVPDRVEDIASVIATYRDEYDAVIVTGGLGPTHDDVTMEGVSRALDRDLVENPDALEWLTEHGGYTREDLTEGTTVLPAGARALHNAEGVAPGAALDGVYVLPGVPEEMKSMFKSIAGEFHGEKRYTGSVVADEPESALIERIDDVRDRFDVTVGSYPGDSVRLKLSGTDRDEVEAALEWLRDRVDEV